LAIEMAYRHGEAGLCMGPFSLVEVIFGLAGSEICTEN
jgi:hypothetical protein